MRIISVLLTVSILFIHSAVFAEELRERKSVQNKVAALFMQERFEELNKLANDYLSSESRTSSGVWKSTLFHAGIGLLVNIKIKDEKHWDLVTQKVLKWIDQYPNSPFAYNSYGLILTRHAWSYRGPGPGKDVKQENRERFKDYLHRANIYLSKHKDLASIDPNWYETMLRVAIGEGWEMDRFNQLVDEAITRYPNFYQNYFTAISYLIPKWHGSKEQIEKFANAAVERTKNTEGHGMYARIYWSASQEQYGTALFTKSDVVWEKMKKGIDDVLLQYPDQWNINSFTFFACLAKDHAKSKELMSRVKSPPIIPAWKRASNFKKCQSLVLDSEHKYWKK